MKEWSGGVRSLILHVRDIKDGAVKTAEEQIEVDQENIEQVAEQSKKSKDFVKLVVADNEDIKNIVLEVAELCRNGLVMSQWDR
jgi:chemotaxis signal transduction protein